MNQGVTFDVSARIVGYEKSLQTLRDALNNIKPGDKIGADLEKRFAELTRHVNQLAKNPLQKFTSDSQINTFTTKLQNIDELFQKIGERLGNVSFQSLDLSQATGEVKTLADEWQNLQSQLVQKTEVDFSDLVNQSKEIQDAFRTLGIDLKDVGTDNAAELLTKGFNELDHKIQDIDSKLPKMTAKLDALRQAQSMIAANPILNVDVQQEAKQLTDVFNNIKPEFHINTEAVEQMVEKIKNVISTSSEDVKKKAQEIDDALANIGNSKNATELEGYFNRLRKFVQDVQKETKEGVSYFGLQSGGVNALFKDSLNPDAIQSAMSQLRQDLEAKGLQLTEQDFIQLNSEAIAGTFDKVIEAIMKKLAKLKDETKKQLEEVNNGIKQQDAEVTAMQQERANTEAQQNIVKSGQTAVEAGVKQIDQSGEIQALKQKIEELEKRIAELTVGKPAENLQKGAQEGFLAAGEAADYYSKELDKVKQREQLVGKIEGIVKRWFSIYAAVRMVSNAIKSMISTVKELDKTITDIAIVTDMSQSDLWSQMPQYTAMAKEYAVSISGVYKVSQLYYQQGLQTTDVMKLSAETLKMARIAGIDYADAADYMTNAVRSFKMEMQDASRVTDAYSALAASSAVTVSELAEAMSKTASSAYGVGASLENTAAMISVMTEATRESASNIGSALKSIISRYGEMKASPSDIIDVDGEEASFNKVDTALKSIGISLKDAQGQFRNFDDVIMELSSVWATLDNNTQRYIATIMAGNRQQSRFLALVSSYDRLKELTAVAAESEDAAQQQFLKTLDSIEAKTQQLQTSMQSLYTTTGIENLYKGLLDVGSNILNYYNNIADTFGSGIQGALAAVASFGTLFYNLAKIVTTIFTQIRAKYTAHQKILTEIAELKAKERAQNGLNQVDKERLAELESYKQMEQQKTQIHNQAEAKRTAMSVKNWLKANRSMIGSSVTVIGGIVGSMISNETLSGLVSGATGIGGGLLQAAGGDWVGGLISIAGSLPQLITGFSELIKVTDKYAASIQASQKAQEKYVEAKTLAKATKDEVTNLEEVKKKLEDYSKHRYDSAEAEEAYYNFMQEIVDQYPSLLSYYDQENRAISIGTEEIEDRIKAQRNLLKEQEREAYYQKLRVDQTVVDSKLFTNQTIDITGMDNIIEKARAGKTASSGFFKNFYTDDTKVASYLAAALQSFLGSNSDFLSDAEIGALFGIDFDNDAIKSKVMDNAVTIRKEGGWDYTEIWSALLATQYEGYVNMVQGSDNAARVYMAKLIEIVADAERQNKSITTAVQRFYDTYLNGIQVSDSYIDYFLNEVIKYTQTTAFDSRVSQLKEGTDLFVNQLEGAEKFSSLEKQALSAQLQEEFLSEYSREEILAMSQDTYAAYVKTFLNNADETLLKRAESLHEDYYGNASKKRITEINVALENLNAYTEAQIDAMIKGIEETEGGKAFKKLWEAKRSEAQERYNDAIEGFSQDLLQNTVFAAANLLENITPRALSIMTKQLNNIKWSDMTDEGKKTAIQGYSDIWTIVNQQTGDIYQDLENLLADHDITTISGIYTVIDNLPVFQGQNELKAKLIELSENIEINFTTEFNSYIDTLNGQLENFEKVLSNAKKGMTLAEAIKLANKLNISINDFRQSAGKFYFDNYEAILKAYLSQQGLWEILQRKYEELSKPEDQELYQRAILARDQFVYAMQESYLELGDINNFLQVAVKEAQDTRSIDELKQLILNGEWSKLPEYLQPYLSKLIEYFNNINKITADAFINSLDGKGAQVINVTDDNRNFLQSWDKYVTFDEEGDQAVIDFSSASMTALRQFRAQVLNNVLKLSEDEKQSVLSSIEKEIYETRDYGTIVQAVGETFQDLDRELAERYAKYVLGFKDLEAAISNGAIIFDKITGKYSVDFSEMQYQLYKLQQTGKASPEQIAELQDMILAVYEDVGNAIVDAFNDGLTHVDYTVLQKKLQAIGIQHIEGFYQKGGKWYLSEQGMYSLYSELLPKNATAANFVLRETKDRLMEVGNACDNIYKTAALIDGITKKIEKGEIQVTDALQAQLKVYKQIRQEQLYDSKSFKTMDASIPEGLASPLAFAQNIVDFKTVGEEVQKAGYVTDQQFYQLVLTLHSYALKTGKEFKLWGQTIDSSEQSVYNALLKFVDNMEGVDGKLQMSLANFGTDFDFSEGIDDATDSVAKAWAEYAEQIAQFYDKLAEIEKLGGADLSGIFEIKDGTVTGWAKGGQEVAQKYVKSIIEQFEIAGQKVPEKLSTLYNTLGLDLDPKQIAEVYTQISNIRKELSNFDYSEGSEQVLNRIAELFDDTLNGTNENDLIVRLQVEGAENIDTAEKLIELTEKYINLGVDGVTIEGMWGEKAFSLTINNADGKPSVFIDFGVGTEAENTWTPTEGEGSTTLHDFIQNRLKTIFGFNDDNSEIDVGLSDVKVSDSGTLSMRAEVIQGKDGSTKYHLQLGVMAYYGTLKNGETLADATQKFLNLYSQRFGAGYFKDESHWPKLENGTVKVIDDAGMSYDMTLTGPQNWASEITEAEKFVTENKKNIQDVRKKLKEAGIVTDNAAAMWYNPLTHTWHYSLKENVKDVGILTYTFSSIKSSNAVDVNKDVQWLKDQHQVLIDTLKENKLTQAKVDTTEAGGIDGVYSITFPEVPIAGSTPVSVTYKANQYAKTTTVNKDINNALAFFNTDKVGTALNKYKPTDAVVKGDATKGYTITFKNISVNGVANIDYQFHTPTIEVEEDDAGNIVPKDLTEFESSINTLEQLLTGASNKLIELYKIGDKNPLIKVTNGRLGKKVISIGNDIEIKGIKVSYSDKLVETDQSGSFTVTDVEAELGKIIDGLRGVKENAEDLTENGVSDVSIDNDTIYLNGSVKIGGVKLKYKKAVDLVDDNNQPKTASAIKADLGKAIDQLGEIKTKAETLNGIITSLPEFENLDSVDLYKSPLVVDGSIDLEIIDGFNIGDDHYETLEEALASVEGAVKPIPTDFSVIDYDKLYDYVKNELKDDEYANQLRAARKQYEINKYAGFSARDMIDNATFKESEKEGKYFLAQAIENRLHEEQSGVKTVSDLMDYLQLVQDFSEKYGGFNDLDTNIEGYVSELHTGIFKQFENKEYQGIDSLTLEQFQTLMTSYGQYRGDNTVPFSLLRARGEPYYDGWALEDVLKDTPSGGWNRTVRNTYVADRLNELASNIESLEDLNKYNELYSQFLALNPTSSIKNLIQPVSQELIDKVIGEVYDASVEKFRHYKYSKDEAGPIQDTVHGVITGKSVQDGLRQFYIAVSQLDKNAANYETEYNALYEQFKSGLRNSAEWNAVFSQAGEKFINDIFGEGFDSFTNTFDYKMNAFKFNDSFIVNRLTKAEAVLQREHPRDEINQVGTQAAAIIQKEEYQDAFKEFYSNYIKIEPDSADAQAKIDKLFADLQGAIDKEDWDILSTDIGQGVFAEFIAPETSANSAATFAGVLYQALMDKTESGSPAQKYVPIGEYIAQGIGVGIASGDLNPYIESLINKSLGTNGTGTTALGGTTINKGNNTNNRRNSLQTLIDETEEGNSDIIAAIETKEINEPNPQEWREAFNGLATHTDFLLDGSETANNFVLATGAGNQHYNIQADNNGVTLVPAERNTEGYHDTLYIPFVADTTELDDTMQELSQEELGISVSPTNLGTFESTVVAALRRMNFNVGASVYVKTIATTGDLSLEEGEAKGNVALSKGTLMGELGPELYVTGGHYYIAGQSGAEFVNLPDDAIVFNHLQTKKLMSTGSAGRGSAVTNEKKATSFATGNVAMATASEMAQRWHAIADMFKNLGSVSARKLASGGGGGGGKDEAINLHDLDRWYNLMRQIEKIEEQITYQQKLRENMRNGSDYIKSLEYELALLEKEQANYQMLSELQKSYYEARRRDQEESIYGKIFTYDEDGLMQYVDGAFRDVLAKMEEQRTTGVMKYTNAQQKKILTNYLLAQGVSQKQINDTLNYKTDGTKVENDEEWIENFWDKFDGWIEEMDSMYDSYTEYQTKVQEMIAEQNKILEEYRDLQLDLEQQLLKAIEDREQAVIDKLQDTYDAINESSQKYIDGLSDALSREQNMYNRNQDRQELTQLQRRLAILQRSGGSGSEILSLQKQIEAQLKDNYFSEQQDQIDAIKEASDAQLEKLQQQIDIAQETLEYQKENGLFWAEVTAIMQNWTPEQMSAFVQEHSREMYEKSPLDVETTMAQTLMDFEKWYELRNRFGAFNDWYDNSMTKDVLKNQYGVNVDNKTELERTRAIAKAAYQRYYAEPEWAQENGYKSAEEAAIAALMAEKNRKAGAPQDYTQGVGSAGSSSSSGSGGKTSGTNGSTNAGTLNISYVVKCTSGHRAGEAVGGSPQGPSTLKVGESGTLSWNCSPGFVQAGTSVSDSSLCSISAGTIKALKAGSVTITVKYWDRTHGYEFTYNGKKYSAEGFDSAAAARSAAEAKINSVVDTSLDTSYGDPAAAIAAIQAALDKARGSIKTYDIGGMVDKTGLALVHAREGVLTPEQVDMLRQLTIAEGTRSINHQFDALKQQLLDLAEPLTTISETTNNPIIINNATVEMNVGSIANDYEARRAGEQALEKMMEIARKTSVQSIRR